MIGCRIGKKTKETARRRRSKHQGLRRPLRGSFRAPESPSVLSASAKDRVSVRASSRKWGWSLVAAAEHGVRMDGTSADIFLARADAKGLLLELRFTPGERVEILRLAATLDMTTEQLIQHLIRQRLVTGAPFTANGRVPPRR